MQQFLRNFVAYYYIIIILKDLFFIRILIIKCEILNIENEFQKFRTCKRLDEFCLANLEKTIIFCHYFELKNSIKRNSNNPNFAYWKF